MATLWQLSVLVFDRKSLISGVILDTSLPSNWTANNFSAAEIIRTYFRSPLCAANIILRMGEEEFATKTDDKGSFSIQLERRVEEEVKVYLSDSSLKLTAVQNYPSYFGRKNGKLHVVSDIDDTLIVSYTASLVKRIRTLLTPVSKRKKVDFTQGLISHLILSEGRVYYVSKSESNLFAMLSHFISKHELPVGHLFLTPYLRFGQLLHPKKGKTFKMECIKKVIDHSGDSYFVLIGDDTQRDIEVYHEIASLYPRQILKIYIRNTGRDLLRRKEIVIENLKQLKVPFFYYTDADSYEEEVKTIKQLMKSTP